MVSLCRSRNYDWEWRIEKSAAIISGHGGERKADSICPVIEPSNCASIALTGTHIGVENDAQKTGTVMATDEWVPFSCLFERGSKYGNMARWFFLIGKM